MFVKDSTILTYTVYQLSDTKMQWNIYALDKMNVEYIKQTLQRSPHL